MKNFFFDKNLEVSHYNMEETLNPFEGIIIEFDLRYNLSNDFIQKSSNTIFLELKFFGHCVIYLHFMFSVKLDFHIR